MVRLPSFSRIIGLSKERLIWNLLMLMHAGLRPILIFINCMPNFLFLIDLKN